MDISQRIGAIGMALLGASILLVIPYEIRKWWRQTPEQAAAELQRLIDDEEEYGPPFP